MSTKTVRELRSIARGKGLHGYCKLNKTDLVALLLEQSAEEMPKSPPRAQSPKEINEFEKERMKKGRPVLKNRLNHGLLYIHGRTFCTFRKKIVGQFFNIIFC